MSPSDLFKAIEADPDNFERWCDAWIEVDNLFSFDVEASLRMADDLVTLHAKHRESTRKDPRILPQKLIPMRVVREILKRQKPPAPIPEVPVAEDELRRATSDLVKRTP